MPNVGTVYRHILGGLVLVIERSTRSGDVVVGRYRSDEGRFFESEFYSFELKPLSVMKGVESGGTEQTNGHQHTEEGLRTTS